MVAGGKELFYRRGDTFIAASVSIADGRVTVGDPRRLFETRAAAGRSTFQAAYSVSADGRFLVHLLDPRAIPTQINLRIIRRTEQVHTSWLTSW